jgi:ribokinase
MLVVVGNACLDVTCRLDRLPEPGETVNAVEVREDLGGKGFNQAIAARRAGADVRFVAAVGDDPAAAAIRARLAGEGIADDCLVAGQGASDRSTILVDRTGENVIVTDARCSTGLDAATVATRLRIAAGDVLLLQGNLGDGATREAAGAARRAAARVVLNPAPFRPSLVDIAGLVDVLVVNAVEARQWAGVADVEAAIPRLGVPLAIVTLGPQGCVLVAPPAAPVRIAAPPAEVRDTVGAGDTFAGVFAAEWLASGHAARAARLAVAAASLKVGRAGTYSALPTADEIRRLRHALDQDEDKDT